MTVISVKQQTDPEGRALVYRIELSDGSVCSIKTSYLSPVYQEGMESILNKELSLEEEEAFHFAAACFQAEQAALNLISRAEQTSAGLSHKLAIRGHSLSCVRAVISYLAEQEILSDARYARLWLQARLAQRGESPRYLITALCNRRINRRLAEKVLTSILHFEDELMLLKKYLQKNRLKDENALTDVLKAKLKYEGFSSAVIQSVWEEGL
jgi:regulatory protein